MVGQLLDVVHQAVALPLPIDPGVPAQCEAMAPLVVSQLADDRLGHRQAQFLFGASAMGLHVDTRVYLGSAELAAMCVLAGRIVKVPEYMEQIKLVNAKVADVYRYMNFDQIPAFVQQAAMVEM